VSAWRVLIGSRSFGQSFPEHLRALEDAGCKVVPNAHGRAYTAAELLETLPSMDAIVTGTDAVTAEVIAASPRLKTIAKHGVGLDTVDVQAARAAGVTVTTTPGTMHHSVADLALALLLALARDVVPLHASVTAGAWAPSTGIELHDRTLGLVGLGRIGREVALRALAFGMTVRACDPYADLAWAAAHGVTVVELDELLSSCDAISLHAPGGERPLLGAEELARLRPGTLVINTARGSLIDEAALAAAIRSGRVGGAGLDVFADEPPNGSPLLGLPGVVTTPHVGGRTREAQRRMGELCLRNCLAGLRGEL
jgi:phosphoglycerate dehydrogenase-like enzyme